MQAYLVRLCDDRQVVGIYAAASLTALQDLVDECTDPAGCEYLAVGQGGIFQPSRVGGQFPPRNSGEPLYEPHPDDGQALCGASYTDGWDARLHSGKAWKALVPALASGAAVPA